MDLEEYRREASLRTEVLNYALRGIPRDRVRLHMCWGSYHGPHKNDLPLRDFVDIVLGINAGAFSIEAANPRHVHEDEVWEEVELPPDTILIPGVIGHYSRLRGAPGARGQAARSVRHAGWSRERDGRHGLRNR